MKVAFYECDVTPPLGGFIWGYYSERFANDVFTRLYAKAVVVQDGDDVSAFVAIDTCSIPEGIHEAVTKRVYEYTGIKPENVCISSDHSHTGAPVHDGPEVGCYKDDAYTDVFFRLCADAIILAYKRLDDAEGNYAAIDVDNLAFCRNFVHKNGAYKGGLKGDKDQKPLTEPNKTLHSIMFERDGKPIGAIVSFPLHQDTTGYSGNREIAYHGDYSAIISRELKKKYGNDFVSVFLLAPCGDINHYNYIDNDFSRHSEEIGTKLANAFLESRKTATAIGEGVKAEKKFIDVPRREFDANAEKQHIIALLQKEGFMRARNIMYYVSKKEPTSTALPVQCVKIGDVLIAALPGEIYTKVANIIRENSPFEKTIVIQNTNAYCGYIPSEEAFADVSDLYEATLCYHSCHVPEAGKMLANTALELADKIKNNK